MEMPSKHTFLGQILSLPPQVISNGIILVKIKRWNTITIVNKPINNLIAFR